MTSRRPRTIALVTPSIEDAGGVPAVARFVARTVERRPDLSVRLVSLATSSRDPCSLLLLDPSTWRRGVTSRAGLVDGRRFIHVGARFGELEFQRLRPRSELAVALAGCDLIQVVAGVPAWAMPVLGLSKPVVLQVATLTAVERRARARTSRGPSALIRAGMTRIVSRFDKAALGKVDAVLVENPWMLEHARKSARPGALVRYGPPGVNTAAFKPARSKTAGAYILSVGRFSDVRKNPSLLLEAYGLLVGRMVDAPRLLMAGADGPPPAFWLRAAELGVTDRVSFEPNPDQTTLARLYREALCFALPSDEEGFGVVLIEAMASGLPVVATRCGGPEGILTEGVDGFLLNRDDAEQMAERLLLLTSDPARALLMGKAARRTVESRYSEHVAGDAFLETYDQLLS